MEDILECCCDLDIHKEYMVACLLKSPIGEGLKPSSEVREVGTQLKDRVALREWLEAYDCYYVAMESTGIYWQPVYAVLENALKDEMHRMVVNARHMKNVLGKKKKSVLHRVIIISKPSWVKSHGSSHPITNCIFLVGIGDSSYVPIPNGQLAHWLANVS